MWDSCAGMRGNLIVTRPVRPPILRPHVSSRSGTGSTGTSSASTPKAPTRARCTLRLLRYPYAILRDLSRGQINLYAMGLVYATLLSLVPLIAFAFAVLKAFGAHRELEPIIYEFFRPVGGSAARAHRSASWSSPTA